MRRQLNRSVKKLAEEGRYDYEPLNSRLTLYGWLFVLGLLLTLIIIGGLS